MVRRGRPTRRAGAQLFARHRKRRRALARVPARRRQLQTRGFVISDPSDVRHGHARGRTVFLRAPNRERRLIHVLKRLRVVPAARHVPKV